MTQKNCKKCKGVIIENYEEYLIKYPNEEEIQCHHCGYIEKVN